MIKITLISPAFSIHQKVGTWVDLGLAGSGALSAISFIFSFSISVIATSIGVTTVGSSSFAPPPTIGGGGVGFLPRLMSDEVAERLRALHEDMMTSGVGLGLVRDLLALLLIPLVRQHPRDQTQSEVSF